MRPVHRGGCHFMAQGFPCVRPPKDLPEGLLLCGTGWVGNPSHRVKAAFCHPRLACDTWGNLLDIFNAARYICPYESGTGQTGRYGVGCR